MNNTIKILNIVGLIFSVLCIISSYTEQDWSELMAWIVVTLYYIKDIFSLKR
jgi:hypothetical protein